MSNVCEVASKRVANASDMAVRGGPPAETPIGLVLAQIGRTVEQVFDEALAAVGGSRPTWLIFLAIISGADATQSQIAERVGITGPTLVHHLDRLEAAGLVVRKADPGNRRVRSVALTPEGYDAFHRMREAAMTFDAALRQDISETQLKALRRVIAQLRINVTTAKK
jgi:MarR family transcriptional regulator for hemolysin